MTDNACENAVDYVAIAKVKRKTLIIYIVSINILFVASTLNWMAYATERMWFVVPFIFTLGVAALCVALGSTWRSYEKALVKAARSTK